MHFSIILVNGRIPDQPEAIRRTLVELILSGLLVDFGNITGARYHRLGGGQRGLGGGCNPGMAALLVHLSDDR